MNKVLASFLILAILAGSSIAGSFLYAFSYVNPQTIPLKGATVMKGQYCTFAQYTTVPIVYENFTVYLVNKSSQLSVYLPKTQITLWPGGQTACVDVIVYVPSGQSGVFDYSLGSRDVNGTTIATASGKVDNTHLSWHGRSRLAIQHIITLKRKEKS